MSETTVSSFNHDRTLHHKFGPAVTQKDLEKALHESGEASLKVPDMTKMKARIEAVGDFADLKKIAAMLKTLQQ